MTAPRTLDELLTVLPGLRRLRRLDAAMLRILLDRRAGDCTWCGNAIPKRRQSWCSDGCVEAFQNRCDPNTVRRLVIRRDGGLCRLCDRDTVAAERDAKAKRLDRRPWREKDESTLDYERRVHEWEIALFSLGYARGEWREVDHDPPVVEGGGLCPVEQLRLLCGACHSEVTASLAGRRAKGGRS